MRENFKDAEPLISELIAEHKAMVNKYFELHDAKNKLNKTEDLTVLLKDLSEHARKEENSLPQLIAALDEEQLKKIDELARHLGYPL